MIWNPKQLYLVSPIVQDIASAMLNDNNQMEARELAAQRLEAIRDYCNYALEQFTKQKTESFKRKVKV